MKNKILFGLITLILLVATIQGVLAVDYNVTHGQILSNNVAAAGDYGIEFYTDENANIVGAYKHPSDAATGMELRSLTYTLLASATFVGDYAEFSSAYSLTAGTTYFIVGTHSGSRNFQYINLGGGSPINDTGFQFVGSYNNGGRNSREYISITHIQVDNTTTPVTSANNFSTVETGSFEFNSPVVIGSSYGIVNSIDLTVDNGNVPYYFASSFTTYGSSNQNADAICKIVFDSTNIVIGSRSIIKGSYGNFKLISYPINLSIGNHTITTQCIKDSVKGYTVINSEMASFNLLDTNINSSVEWLNVNDSVGFSVSTVDSLLDSFIFTTTNTSNTTNVNNVVVHFRSSYSYSVDSDITTYIRLEETGEVCGNYTRGGTAGSVGSLGSTCVFENLNSSTAYNFSINGFTSVGNSNVIDVLLNVYELKLNETAISTTSLTKVVPAGVLTEVAIINISNVLGGSYNVFVDGGLMVNSSTSQQAFFYLSNSDSSVNYSRTINNFIGNVNTQHVFSESGTGINSYSLMAFCVSGCEIVGGDLSAFVTDADSVSTGVFDITAYNSYNSTPILVFNATIGGTTISTTNGTITAIGQGSVIVLVEANNFFSNSTIHDTTNNHNTSLYKYTEIRANNFQGGAVSSFFVNMTGYNYTTTNGVAYLPANNNSVTFNSVLNSEATETITKTQYFNFTVYAENSVLTTFVDSVSENVILNVSLDYFSTTDSGTESTNNGSIYLTLLNPESYTFRYNSSGYDTNLFFTTIVDDTFSNITLYMNPISNTTAITIEIVDSGAAPVENAQVKALKYYVADNTYRVVGSGITNPDGETVIALVTGSEFYKFVVVIDDIAVKTTSPFIITGTTIRIQVLTGENILTNFREWRGIESTLVFNDVSNSFRFDFTDANNVNREVCMKTYLQGVLSDTLLNTTCVVGTSGTILTAVNNVTGLTYYSIATTTINGEEYTLGKETHTFNEANLGDGGLLAQLLLTLVISLSGFIAIELIFLMAPLSIIIGGLAGLHNISLALTVPMLIMGIMLMFILKRNR